MSLVADYSARLVYRLPDFPTGRLCLLSDFNPSPDAPAPEQLRRLACEWPTSGCRRVTDLPRRNGRLAKRAVVPIHGRYGHPKTAANSP